MFQGISPLGRGILKKKNVRDTIHFNGGLFIPRISSVSAEQSQSGVEQILERQVKAVSKVLAKHHQKIKSNRRISSHWLIFQEHASGNRMLQSLKDFNSMPFMSKIEYLRTTAKFYHPIEKGNHYVYNSS